MGHEVNEQLILPINAKCHVQASAKLTDKNNDTKDLQNIKKHLTVATTADPEIEDHTNVPKDNDKPNGDAVNPSAQHKHIIWTKNHYERYLKLFRQQSSISNFMVIKAPPLPPFAKAALAEYVTEFIIDCNLITDFKIPQQTMITDNVTCKAETVDQLDITTMKNSTAHVDNTQMGWFIGDNVTVNDVAIWYLCITVDPTGLIYNPAEIRGRCIEHAIHLMEYDTEATIEDLHPDFANLEVNVSMDIEARPEDAATKVAAGITDFEPGDVIRKILAFIAQAIDMFCIVADKDKTLPALSYGKWYADFQLDEDEWEIISLAHQALVISANAHSELLAEKTPTCQHVYPVIERLQFQWEKLTTNAKFDPVLPALEAGLKNTKTWYHATDWMSIYFICHKIDDKDFQHFFEIQSEDYCPTKMRQCSCDQRAQAPSVPKSKTPKESNILKDKKACLVTSK
ncbi:hypothetical protein ARMGADRAFT_1038411 [Armillaria gallica]|uniref:Uncharacterized protein n=1 Tax=Armillaria gallica TaxID=47427 RepID=A0A2H3CI70_ARMGA|nr:hypothetical protein ARMGADRAFT_1038411 [Armillaria gallica]